MSKGIIAGKRSFTLNGKSYKLSKLTLGDYADYNLFLEDSKRDDLIKVYRKLQKSDEYIEDKLMNIVMTEEDIDKYGKNILSGLFLIHCALKDQDILFKDFINEVKLSDMKEIEDIIKFIGDQENDEPNNKKKQQISNQ